MGNGEKNYCQDPELDIDQGLIIILNIPQHVHHALGLPSVTAGLRMPHVPVPAVTSQQGATPAISVGNLNNGLMLVLKKEFLEAN